MAIAASYATPRLRPMRETDLPQIMRIERRAYTFPWPESHFRLCLRTRTDCVVLAADDVIEGYGVMAMEQGRAHIMNVCVRVEAQGRGLGTRIMRHLLRLARRRGAGAAFLEVRPSNTTARTFYQRMGFGDSGIRNAYYPARRGRENAVIMTRAL